MKCPVEIEFAVNLEHSPQIFHVLQIRPISADSLNAQVEWDKIDESGAFLRSGAHAWRDPVLGVCRHESGMVTVLMRYEQAVYLSAAADQRLLGVYTCVQNQGIVPGSQDVSVAMTAGSNHIKAH